MGNVVWTKKFNVIRKGSPIWEKGINEVLISQLNSGLFCSAVLFYNQFDRKEGEAFFRLEQFFATTVDEAWNAVDAWVNEFYKGTGSFEYQERL